MNTLAARICVAAAIIVFAVELAAACTTFVIRDEHHLVLGKNLDWFAGYGLVIVNKRGLMKEGLPQQDGNPAAWVAKYGSITFNQVGKELPYGGMNEAGLVVEQMMLNATVYPSPDDRPALGECQWIQYQIDNSATVDQVVASDSLIRISPASTPLHFLVCDSTSSVATVEFLHGEMIAHAGDDLPAAALANSIYSESMECLSRGRRPDDNLSLQHFVDAASMVEAYDPVEGGPVVDYAFRILREVDQGDFTKWSIVYDIKNMQIHFRTSAESRIKTLEFRDFDYGCQSPSMAADIDLNASGEVNELLGTYTAEMNKEVILKTFDVFREQGFLDVPEASLIWLSEYPDGFKCVED